MFKSIFSKLNLSTYVNAVFFTSKILLYLPQSLTAPPPQPNKHTAYSANQILKQLLVGAILVH